MADKVLEQVGSSPHQTQCFCPVPVGLRVAARHLPFGTPLEQGLALHVHRVVLCPHWVLGGLDVHHQLHVPLRVNRGSSAICTWSGQWFPQCSVGVDVIEVCARARARARAHVQPRHSLPWNEFLAQDPGRTWPVLHNAMAMVLGPR